MLLLLFNCVHVRKNLKNWIELHYFSQNIYFILKNCYYYYCLFPSNIQYCVQVHLKISKVSKFVQTSKPSWHTANNGNFWIVPQKRSFYVITSWQWAVSKTFVLRFHTVTMSCQSFCLYYINPNWYMMNTFLPQSYTSQ
jgi:hypothetical protein